MKTKIPSALGVMFLIAATGCASSAPPQELKDARTAYDAASRGPAAQYAPTDLHIAQQSLATAERSFKDDGDSADTRDIAYSALRKAQLADARGRTAQSIKMQNEASAQAQALREQQARLTSAELQSTRAQLASERERREDAEKRAQQAAQDLARLGSVKQDARGIVLTLSGGVLFTSGKSELLPSARAKLGEVANVLSQQDPDSKIVVQGFTDSQGSKAFNMTLSQKRAESVRDYLVSHGVASDRITAEGLGPSNPIADNSSAEGRANNRRVEIVVQPPGGKGPSTVK